jgi:TfoX/Sxy family transcriptional regulator of competence genes
MMRAVAYDEELADRLRALLALEPGLSERRMFGGLAFLVDGRMSVAVSGSGGLMARVEPEEADALLDEPHVHVFVMRERPLDGWLRVDAAGVRTDAELQSWVDRGVAVARALGPKR